MKAEHGIMTRIEKFYVSGKSFFTKNEEYLRAKYLEVAQKIGGPEAVYNPDNDLMSEFETD